MVIGSREQTERGLVGEGGQEQERPETGVRPVRHDRKVAMV